MKKLHECNDVTMPRFVLRVGPIKWVDGNNIETEVWVSSRDGHGMWTATRAGPRWIVSGGLVFLGPSDGW